MDSRRDFIKKASVLSAGSGLLNILPASIAKAIAIDPAPGTTYLDAEHIVFLMQENRSFDHTYGTLQGVRGFNDPRAIRIPGNNLVWLQSNSQGVTYAPFRFDIKETNATWMSSLPHSWANQVDARNNGKYNGWLDSKRSGNEDYENMPLTLGFYSRADIPFYYSLADAFTVCDQHFCSSLTGTTPNRLYFWTGTIREKADAHSMARVWNEDADHRTMVDWKTFPERMEGEGIPWKIYQNELSVGSGFEGEEDPWLSNFGDNPIEYFKQYNVKLHPEYIAALPKMQLQLKELLVKKEQEMKAQVPGSDEEKGIKDNIEGINKTLQIYAEDEKIYTLEKYNQLSPHEKSIHEKAFANNRQDPFYHQLASIAYKDGNEQREVLVPKGDVFHQFRQDVQAGQLPTVSWLVAPENFSDHPSSAWYGAWYISEVMDILTKNPEVWKKTIFILTYDENDGYFDHVPPFVAPHPDKKETGLTSGNMNTAVDYVANESQQSIKDHARESPIGLGYRVPLVVASPWSRGGWVNSQVFDHTSALQFLEKFLSHKTGKKIEEPNISKWRRTVCGDLTSIFRPYNGEKVNKPLFLQRDAFIKSIHKAQFKNPPSNFKKLTNDQIVQINKDPRRSPLMPSQEKGIRSACALPYELYTDGSLTDDKRAFQIMMKTGNQRFDDGVGGSPFHIYARTKYLSEEGRNWAYAVAGGDELQDRWMLADFEQGHYHLNVYGPNGFFREFTGDENDPDLDINVRYERDKRNEKQLTGNIQIDLLNKGRQSLNIMISDNAYKSGKIQRTFSPNAKGSNAVIINTNKSYGWYDFTIHLSGNKRFSKRYAGRVENGLPGKTDPLMGRVI